MFKIYKKNKKFIIIILFSLIVFNYLPQFQNNYIVEAKTTNNKLHTVESKLSSSTKRIINKIKKSNKKSIKFNYNIKTYNELTQYLNSNQYIIYEDGIFITKVSLVKKRIKSVEYVNKILYNRANKLYCGKNIKTLKRYENYICKKIHYKLQPDIYKSMRNGSCVVYSNMLKIMCDISGIPCKIYAGWATPQDGHCWNRVKIKNKWYWVDLCWEDNSLYNDYSYSRSLWFDHLEYKNLWFGIYKVLLSY